MPSELWWHVQSGPKKKLPMTNTLALLSLLDGFWGSDQPSTPNGVAFDISGFRPEEQGRISWLSDHASTRSLNMAPLIFLSTQVVSGGMKVGELVKKIQMNEPKVGNVKIGRKLVKKEYIKT